MLHWRLYFNNNASLGSINAGLNMSVKNELEILFHWNRCVAWHCIETCIPSLEWFGPTVTKLCSGQGNPDADADTADAVTADRSNPYMSPLQATQKHLLKHNWDTEGIHFNIIKKFFERNDIFCFHFIFKFHFIFICSVYLFSFWSVIS